MRKVPLAIWMSVVLTASPAGWAETPEKSEGSVGARIDDSGRKVWEHVDHALDKTADALKDAGRAAGEFLDKAGNAASDALKSATSRRAE